MLRISSSFRLSTGGVFTHFSSKSAIGWPFICLLINSRRLVLANDKPCKLYRTIAAKSQVAREPCGTTNTFKFTSSASLTVGNRNLIADSRLSTMEIALFRCAKPRNRRVPPRDKKFSVICISNSFAKAAVFGSLSSPPSIVSVRGHSGRNSKNATNSGAGAFRKSTNALRGIPSIRHQRRTCKRHCAQTGKPNRRRRSAGEKSNEFIEVSSPA